MNDYDLVIIIVGLASYLAAIVQGIMAFGDAITVHLLWRVAVLIVPDVMNSTPFGENHLLATALILAVRAVVVQVCFVGQSLHLACKPLLKVVLPIQVTFVLAGAWVLDRFSGAEWLGTLLGGFFGIAAVAFGFVSVKQLMRNRKLGKRAVAAAHKSFKVTPVVQFAMGLAAVGSGLIAGLCGIGGPPVMIASVALDIPQPVLRGTFPFASLLAFVIRVIASILAGVLTTEAWMIYVAAGLGAIAGLQVGIEVSGHVSHDEFIVGVCWLMLFASIALAKLPGPFVLVAFALFALSMVAIRHSNRKPSRPRPDPASAAGVDGRLSSPDVSPEGTPTSDKPELRDREFPAAPPPVEKAGMVLPQIKTIEILEELEAAANERDERGDAAASASATSARK